MGQRNQYTVGYRICKQCLKNKSLDDFKGSGWKCRACKDKPVNLSRYEKELSRILFEVKSDFMTHDLDRHGETLDTILLRVERNLRLMDDGLVSQVARCYSDPDLMAN